MSAGLVLTLLACGLLIWLFVVVTRKLDIWWDVQTSVFAVFALILFLLTVIFLGIGFAQPLRPTCDGAVGWLLGSDTTLLAGLAMLAGALGRVRQGAFPGFLLAIGPIGIVLFVALTLGSLQILETMSPGCWG